MIILNLGAIIALIANLIVFWIGDSYFDTFTTNHELIYIFVILIFNLIMEPFLSPRIFWIPLYAIVGVIFIMTCWKFYGMLTIIVPVAIIGAAMGFYMLKGKKNEKTEVEEQAQETWYQIRSHLHQCRWLLSNQRYFDKLL